MFLFILRCFNVIITCKLFHLVAIVVILTQSQVPSDARDCRHSAELMDYVARKEVNVIVVERNASILDALAFQLIELGVLDPRDALRNRRFVKVELQLFGEHGEGLRSEGDHVFCDAVLFAGLAAVNGFENSYERT